MLKTTFGKRVYFSACIPYHYEIITFVLIHSLLVTIPQRKHSQAALFISDAMRLLQAPSTRISYGLKTNRIIYYRKKKKTDLHLSFIHLTTLRLERPQQTAIFPGLHSELQKLISRKGYNFNLRISQ